MLKHIPALTKMISLILNKDEESKAYIEKMGSYHYVWGVQEHDFHFFAIALCDSMQNSLGGDIINQTVRDAWFNTITKLGASMIKKAKKLDINGISCICFRRNRMTSWKECSIFLTLKDLHIYRNSKMAKIKTSVNLSDILTIDFEDNDSISKKTDFCLNISKNDDDLWLCFETLNEANYWKDELNWRMHALHLLKNKIVPKGSKSKTN